jgi:hypothetical protein
MLTKTIYLMNEKIDDHNCLQMIQEHPLNEHLQLFVHQVVIKKIYVG